MLAGWKVQCELPIEAEEFLFELRQNRAAAAPKSSAGSRGGHTCFPGKVFGFRWGMLEIVGGQRTPPPLGVNLGHECDRKVPRF
jgi:hypothetical protein